MAIALTIVEDKGDCPDRGESWFERFFVTNVNLGAGPCWPVYVHGFALAMEQRLLHRVLAQPPLVVTQSVLAKHAATAISSFKSRRSSARRRDVKLNIKGRLEGKIVIHKASKSHSWIQVAVARMLARQNENGRAWTRAEAAKWTKRAARAPTTTPLSVEAQAVYAYLHAHLHLDDQSDGKLVAIDSWACDFDTEGSPFRHVANEKLLSTTAWEALHQMIVANLEWPRPDVRPHASLAMSEGFFELRRELARTMRHSNEIRRLLCTAATLGMHIDIS